MRWVTLFVESVIIVSKNVPFYINFSKYFSQSLVVLGKCRNFAAHYAYLQAVINGEMIVTGMTAIQLNAEIYRTMGVIAEDEGLLKQALKYLKKLATKKQDETLMTKEEFFARVDKAKEGKSAAMLPNENLTEFLRRQGYDL